VSRTVTRRVFGSSVGLPIFAIETIVHLWQPNIYGVLAGEVEVSAEVGQGIRQRQQGRGAVRLRDEAGRAHDSRALLTWP